MQAMNLSGERAGTIQTSDGVGIYYRILGNGRRTVLFMHGWAGSGSGTFWDPLLKHISVENMRLVLVDLRGHVRSEHTRNGFQTERFGKDMLDVADHLGAGELILVAYSMSGRWAQWMSCTHPERVIGQLLLGPAPASPMRLSEELIEDWLHSARTRDGFHALERRFVKRPLADDLLDGSFEAARNTPEHTLRQTLLMCGEASFQSQLAATRAATVVIGGIHDPLITPDYLRQEVVRHIPGARLALLDCGHNLPQESPLETAAVVEAFLTPMLL